MEESICSRIRELISYYNISDRQFAIKIGVTQSVIGSMFQKQTEPSAKVLKLILSVMNVFPPNGSCVARGKCS